MILNRQSSVEALNCKIDLSGIYSLKSAKLIHVDGTGMLTARSCSVTDSCYGIRYLSQIGLNGIPLVQINSPGCPTCASLLATGYGISNAGCRELADIQENLNAPFVSLDSSITAITPLLSLLDSGLYLIADAECYPTDGNGNFFWNTPNQPVENPATAGVLLPDADFAYISGHPLYLYPTQDTDCYNEERVGHYVELFQRTTAAPRAVVYCFSEFISFILDGHHKACAAALLKIPLSCTVIMPFTGFGYRQSNGRAVPAKLCFSDISIPIDAAPHKFLPAIPKRQDMTRPFPMESGIINHRKWESNYLKSADSYPTVWEYADITASGLPHNEPLTDGLLEACLTRPEHENIQKLKSALFILKRNHDPRLKRTAIICAKEAWDYKLKKLAYKILSDIKDDSEVEQLFIDYLAYCEDKHDPVLPIVDSYWR